MNSTEASTRIENSVTSDDDDDGSSTVDLSEHDIKPSDFDAGICSSPSSSNSEIEKNREGSPAECFSLENVKSENADDQFCDSFGTATNMQEPLVEAVPEIVVKNEEMDVTENTEAGDMQNFSCQHAAENIVAPCNLSSDHKPTSKRKNSELRCTECSFRCMGIEKLTMHVRAVHEQGESFACGLCSFECKWNREYYKHMRTHFIGPPYQCDFKNCTAKCDRIQHLLYHRMNHTEERPFSCCICPLKFKIKSTLMVHLRKHTGYNPFTCTECERSFSTKGALQQHAVTHSDKRAFLCDQCGFSTKHQSHLISHRRIHAGDVLQCQLENCSYKTTKRSQLLAHMQSHLRIKTFFCEECEQGFVAKSHLKRHQLIHVAIKPFSCDFCDYSSNRKDKLRLHVMKHHGDGSNLPAYVRSKQRAGHSPRSTKCSELEVPEVDNDTSSCIKFQQMVEKVDEQLNSRRITKYIKVPSVEYGSEAVDLSNSAEVESSETAVAEEDQMTT